MRKNLHTRVCIAESLGCTLETNATFSVNYISIKKSLTTNLIPFCVSGKGLCGATMCQDLPGGPSDKEPTCQCRKRRRLGLHPWVGKIPWRGAWHPTPVLLPGESHAQRSLAGYSPWSCKESDTTEDTYNVYEILYCDLLQSRLSVSSFFFSISLFFHY